MRHITPTKGTSRSEAPTPLGHVAGPGFALVLAGGGARGFAHAGALDVLERSGLRPSGIVGVSMGAVVGVAYAVRTNWFDAVMTMDTTSFPGPFPQRRGRGLALLQRVRRALSYTRTAEELFRSWGPGARAAADGREALSTLLGDSRLEDLQVPVAVSCTDLLTGTRVVLRTGSAVDAVYASAALAGVLPPRPHDGWLLADGAYSDVAPVDVARTMAARVVVVDPGQLTDDPTVTNGFQAVMRAMEICHHRHAHLRLEEADLVIRPGFRRPVDVLEFSAARECAAAGARATRAALGAIESLLDRPH